MHSPKVLFRTNIPDICHFFTRAKFLENKIYTEKHQFFALNLSKMPIFRVKSVKIYTDQKFFLINIITVTIPIAIVTRTIIIVIIVIIVSLLELD